MPMLEPDLSEIDVPIAAGTYKGKIIEVEVKTSQKGNPMIVPKFEVDVEGKRRVRQAYLVITGQGAYGFAGLLKSTGFADVAAKMKAGEKVPFDTDSLINQECNLVIEPEEYNGEMRDKIASFLPL